MLSILVITFIGCLAGCVAGLSPAVNVTVTVVIFYPWLSDLQPLEILCFYIGLLVASQYLGSVIASVFGIPGEASSVPAVREGYAMCCQGRLQDALKISALSSALGGAIAVIMVGILIWTLTILQTFYSLIIQSIILVLCLLLTSYIGHNRLRVNVLLMVAGIVIGTAGVSQTRNSTWFTEWFSITDPYVMTGLPLELGFIFLYVLPNLLSRQRSLGGQIHVAESTAKKFDQYWTSVRGGIIGFFAGLIPGLTFTISSQIAYVMQRWLSRDNRPGDRGCLAAAESANNSAIVSYLIPLLIFGIPIGASEILIYDLMISNGAVFGMEWFHDPRTVVVIIAAFLLANIVALCAAWPAGKKLSAIVYKNQDAIYVISFALVAMALLIVAYQENAMAWYLQLSLLLLPISYLLRQLDCLPLVFGFVISGNFDRVLSQTIYLYLT